MWYWYNTHAEGGILFWNGRYCTENFVDFHLGKYFKCGTDVTYTLKGGGGSHKWLSPQLVIRPARLAPNTRNHGHQILPPHCPTFLPAGRIEKLRIDNSPNATRAYANLLDQVVRGE